MSGIHIIALLILGIFLYWIFDRLEKRRLRKLNEFNSTGEKDDTEEYVFRDGEY